MASGNAKRVSKQFTQKYEAPPATVFPLLCPVRESEWLDGWKCNLIYSKSGIAEEGCIFTTQFPGDPTESIWLWVKHDKENHEVQFYRVIPGIMVIRAGIKLKDDSRGSSDVIIDYEYTILSESSTQIAENMANIEMTMLGWMEKSINHFLKTGSKLTIQDNPVK
jgi:hypothetical protein